MPFVSLTQFPILVCGFTLAIATYFVLPTEPPIWILWIAGVALILLAVLVSVIGRWRSLAMLAGVMIIGFGWAQMRTHWVAAHYAAPSFAGVGKVNLRGVITWAEVQPRSYSTKLILRSAVRYNWLLKMGV